MQRMSPYMGWRNSIYSAWRYSPVSYTHLDLDLEIDPKLSWALRHPEQFPVDINKADYEMLLRVPGVEMCIRDSPLSVTLTPEAMILVKKYMNRDPSSRCV